MMLLILVDCTYRDLVLMIEIKIMTTNETSLIITIFFSLFLSFSQLKESKAFLPQLTIVAASTECAQHCTWN